MGWIILGFVVFTIILLRCTKCELANPVFIFELVWLTVIFMYLLQGEKYYSLSTRAFVVLLLGIGLFPVGYWLGMKSKIIIKKERNTLKSTEVYSLRMWIFWIASLISVGILINNDMIIIRNLLSGLSFYDMARLGISTEETNGMMAYALIFLVYPFVTIASPVCATEYFSDSRFKNRYLLLNCILVMLSVLDHGGRIYLINMVICYVFSALLHGKKVHLTKRQKRWILGLVCIIGIVVLALSFSRGITDLWESIKLYLGGCIPHMVVRMNQYEFSSQHTFGFLSLRGFIVPLVLCAQFFGFFKNPGKRYLLAEEIAIMIEEDVYIGELAKTNAFLPAQYYFYIDFGYVGVIVGTIIYGAIVGYAYKQAKVLPSKKSMAWYLFLLYGLAFAFVRFPFKTYQYAMGCIYLLLIYKKRKGVFLHDE